MSFDIAKIPPIMRRKGWVKGATLMESWFARSANDKPKQGIPDTTTITMDWVLGFDRARQVFDQVIAEPAWLRDKARTEIGNWLAKKGKLVGQEVDFGPPMNDVVGDDPDYVQRASVGNGATDPADDLLAALGTFNFRVLVKGKVGPKGPSRYRVAIDTVGIYVADSYDFNDDYPWLYSQPLGSWTDDDFAGKISTSGTAVSNADFRNYRATHGKGGDFMVFSNIRVIPRNPPDVFEFDH